MSTYVIGDVQGCFASLQALLRDVQFNAANDTLWFTGDLVNRGPDSLSVLRFVKALGDQQISVLGNHDLHLLAVARGGATLHPKDTLHGILHAPDCDQLLDWLQSRRLLHYDADFNAVLTHAGLAPMWSLTEAMQFAREVEVMLQSDHAADFLRVIYGNQPDVWNAALTGNDRLRCIVNYFTRMRLCHADGRLDFAYNGALAGCPPDLFPWFSMPMRQEKTVDILFGHWAALNGEVTVPHVYALDTGCVWGKTLTALCLETKARFSVPFI